MLKKQSARGALSWAVSSVESAPLGTRNVTLNDVSFFIGRLLAADDFEYPHDTLVDAAMSAGLAWTEAKGTVRSGLCAGFRASISEDRLIGKPALYARRRRSWDVAVFDVFTQVSAALTAERGMPYFDSEWAGRIPTCTCDTRKEQTYCLCEYHEDLVARHDLNVEAHFIAVRTVSPSGHCDSCQCAGSKGTEGSTS